MNKKAFTLLELLVVVLIIGILAAIALPQYNKAIEKAKVAEGVNVIKTVARAADVYYLSNGNYPDKFADLDVEISWTGTVDGGIWERYVTDTRSNKDWSLQIFHAYSHNIAITRLAGKYEGVSLMWSFHQKLSSNPEFTLYCYAKNAQVAQDFCTRLMKGKSVDNNIYLITF